MAMVFSTVGSPTKTGWKRRVLLDVLAVLVECGGADHAQLAAREHRLEHVARVHGPLGLPRADERVQFVDEHDELPFARGDLLEHGLEPFLELAAELRARDEGAEIQRHELLVAQRLGHVAVHDALGEPLGDGGLAHPGFADEHRIVLGAPREDLHDAADLLVSADDRIELALARVLGEVTRELLQRLVLVLRRLVGDLVRAAHHLERLEQALPGDALRLEQVRGLRALGVGERDEQVLGAHVLVAEGLGLLLGLVEDRAQFACEVGLGVGLLGVARDLALERLRERRDRDTHLLQDGDDDALILREERGEEVRVVDQRVAVATRVADGVGEGFLGLHGQAIRGQHLRMEAEG
jgi:hypothetical protein